MSNINLTVLGSASALPGTNRYPSAQILSVNGRLFLIDAGEGVQQRLRQAHLSFSKLEAVFISHIHGDHVFGLPGLLSTMSMLGRTGRLDVYGPDALGGMLRWYDTYYGEGMNFPVEFHPVRVSTLTEIHQSRRVRVSAFPLNHKIECYGYRFDEIRTPRTAQAAPPHSFAYCSDTAPDGRLKDWVRGVDLLYHEATYPQEMAAKARSRFHSTAQEAATLAREAQAGRLLVGHFSSRYPDTELFRQEALALFPRTELARELETFVL